ncbi:MAG: hypothetical protein RsTaC01_0641 [Candidatus Paraimprobicoccus trichonymphae]|uniref:Uncharacterized protein n=1 Tax=Candidatus Paraimprobicoccus trichonymphae TaxID=3033793 RepID=A0AA48HZS8_9FIRM|nr:MAG: hypothetical protein RsTaC01_0641 [Candidatus Paraimprobicoccus trichonymphae]
MAIHESDSQKLLKEKIATNILSQEQLINMLPELFRIFYISLDKMEHIVVSKISDNNRKIWLTAENYIDHVMDIKVENAVEHAIDEAEENKYLLPQIKSS